MKGSEVNMCFEVGVGSLGKTQDVEVNHMTLRSESFWMENQT